MYSPAVGRYSFPLTLKYNAFGTTISIIFNSWRYCVTHRPSSRFARGTAGGVFAAPPPQPRPIAPEPADAVVSTSAAPALDTAKTTPHVPTWTPVRAAAAKAYPTAAAVSLGSKRARIDDEGTARTPLMDAGGSGDGGQGRRARPRLEGANPASTQRRVWRAGRTPFQSKATTQRALEPSQVAVTDTARKILATLDSITPVRT